MSDVRRMRMAPGGACPFAAQLRPAPAEGPGLMVAEALADVRARGDAALLDSIRRFDCPAFGGSDAIVDPARIAEAQTALDPILRAAIDVAVSNVRAVEVHERYASGAPITMADIVKRLAMAPLGPPTGK
jgi:histidinol dehydrogenase